VQSNKPWIGRSARESYEAAACLWNYGLKSKATPRLFERRIKDKIKEIETFVTTYCWTDMFFAFCLIFLVL
jgi:hypothetical protein